MHPVLSTSAGDWFLPADGGTGSLLRVADGIGAVDVRRIRDLGLPGLLPIGNVAENGQVWLRTPQPPGPTLDEALRFGLGGLGLGGLGLGGFGVGGADGVAVISGVVRVLADLHARGLVHGRLDGEAVLLDPDGSAVVVMLCAGDADPAADTAAAARLARAVAVAWCEDDPERAEILYRCAARLEGRGARAALDVLPTQPRGGHEALRRMARTWTPCPSARG